MVILWTFGDMFKSLYFIFRDAPMQFWICGFLQVTIDLIILLQVYIYKGNSNVNRPGVHRIDWVVVQWTVEECKQHEQTKTELTVVDERTYSDNLSFALVNGNCDLRDTLEDLSAYAKIDPDETQSENFVVSAQVHNEGGVFEKCSSESSDNITKDSNNVEYLYRNINGGCCTGEDNGDKFLQTCSVTYKKSSKVSMFIHRHTLWHTILIKCFRLLLRLPV